MILVPNIVEANGKTVRQNNLALTHAIPLGTLVEINLSYDSSHGCRLYVAKHTRDCDGTPLYSLSACRDGETDLVIRGYSDDCLIVVKP